MIDLSTSLGQVRMLLNDVDESAPIFSDDEIRAFLTMEGDHVKLAAAQALDTIADNEVLASKVLRTQDGTSIDGAKAADSLRRRAQSLRDQHYQAVTDGENVDGGGAFTVPEPWPCAPELAASAAWPYGAGYGYLYGS